MKVQIRSISPDGLEVKFEEGFFFNTYDEAFEFIKRVDSLDNEISLRGRTMTPSEVFKSIKMVEKT